MKELETQLSLAQKQKDEMQQALEDAKSNANANRYTLVFLYYLILQTIFK